MEQLLPAVWFAILGFILLLYTMLDGFDLGVGIVSLLVKDDRERGTPDGQPGKHLGRQRDVARSLWRHHFRSISRRVRPRDDRLVHSADRDARRPHFSRRVLRVPRARAEQEAVGPRFRVGKPSHRGQPGAGVRRAAVGCHYPRRQIHGRGLRLALTVFRYHGGGGCGRLRDVRIDVHHHENAGPGGAIRATHGRMGGRHCGAGALADTILAVGKYPFLSAEMGGRSRAPFSRSSRSPSDLLPSG